MRITIVQYGGDYREAWRRFDRGGKATYQAQRYSVGFVASLAERFEQVTVVCALTDAAYDELLPNRVRAVGAGLKPGFHARDLIPIVAPTNPDRLILVTPMVPLLKWAAKERVRTLMTLADSFRKGGIVSALRHRRLAHFLNGANVEWVGNHGIGACLSLMTIGVNPDKIIPWDWPPSHTPSNYPERSLDKSKSLHLIFVGSVSEDKGVGDLLRAIRQLKNSGPETHLTIVGADHDGAMHELANQLGLHSNVTFAGVIPNEDVPEKMRAADVVVIPSRHEYPEGLPLTIYEALAARTPIIASDHPMFFGALSHEQTALVFRASDASSLADAIRRLASDAELYSEMSKNSERAWQALQLPVTWGELIERWLADNEAGRNWLREHRLDSGLYRSQIAARSNVESNFDA
jgi:glycosyltransferase involved in cell wall biosynthesis